MFAAIGVMYIEGVYLEQRDGIGLAIALILLMSAALVGSRKETTP